MVIRTTFFMCYVFAMTYTCSVLAKTTAIIAGNLVFPDKGEIVKNQVVVIKADKIIYIGNDMPEMKIDNIYDLSSSYVLPGLMDAHTHVTAEIPNHPGISEHNSHIGIPYYYESTAYRTLRGVRNLELLLNAGFTTIRDVGNEANYAMTDVDKAIKVGWFNGPTLFHAGKIIAPFGGQSISEPLERGDLWKLEYIDADTHDEIRKAIRKNIYYGANIIKLVTGDQSYSYSIEDIKFAVNEAHRAGITIAVHAMEGEAAKNAILGGADSIEHGFFLSKKLLNLMNENDVVLVATPFPEEHNIIYYGGQEEKARQESLFFIEQLKLANEIGVTLAFGTDVYYEVPDKNRVEASYDFLDMWQKANIPNKEILKAMTSNIAALLKIEHKRGRLAEGLYADIIALDKNPFSDINAIRSVKFVMKEGEVIRNELKNP